MIYRAFKFEISFLKTTSLISIFLQGTHLQSRRVLILNFLYCLVYCNFLSRHRFFLFKIHWVKITYRLSILPNQLYNSFQWLRVQKKIDWGTSYCLVNHVLYLGSILKLVVR